MDQNSVPLSQHTVQLEKSLHEALLRKERLRADLKVVNKEITALRNILAGIALAQTAPHPANKTENENIQEE
tara:strand:- start:10191 stop:10406 length:216 start_codon:yes stop_codon:yes gene_type:complete